MAELAAHNNGSLHDVAFQLTELLDYARDCIENGYFETAFDDERCDYGPDDCTPDPWTNALEGHITAIESAFESLRHDAKQYDLPALFASLQAHQRD